MEIEKIRKPDFFIVGAPKCGTTAMQYYLRQHPDIFMPEEKELHFFGNDLNFRRSRPNEDEYLSYFRKAGNEKRIGEASVWYLYSKSAPNEIKSFSTSASIIIMLRNPVDMLYSLHSQFVYNGWEPITDFKAAINAEEGRKKGYNFIPESPIFVEAYFYRELGLFTSHVKRWIDTFGYENVKIVIFENFTRDTAGVCKEIFRFLCVDEDFKVKFKIVNPNKTVRFMALSDFLNNPSPVVLKLGKFLVPKLLRTLLIQGLHSINTKYEPRPPMPFTLRQHLQEYFRPEVEKLSNLLGRDLTFWCR